MPDDTWRERVGALLQRARRARNWSVRRAAREAGVDDATWRHLEEGERVIRGQVVPASPRDDTLAAVARAVGLDPRVVFEAAGREFVELDDSVTVLLPPIEEEVAELRQRIEDIEAEIRRRGDPDGRREAG